MVLIFLILTQHDLNKSFSLCASDESNVLNMFTGFSQALIEVSARYSVGGPLSVGDEQLWILQKLSLKCQGHLALEQNLEYASPSIPKTSYFGISPVLDSEPKIKNPLQGACRFHQVWTQYQKWRTPPKNPKKQKTHNNKKQWTLRLHQFWTKY